MAGLSAHDGLVGVATGTTLGMTAALAAVAVALHLRFGAFLSPLCALRVSIAAAAAWWVAHVVPSHTALQSLLAVAAGGVAYLVALVAIRELGPRDLAMVTAIVRRQPRPKS